MQKIFFEILVLTALTVGLIWTILELTPKSALLSFTILYTGPISSSSQVDNRTGYFVMVLVAVSITRGNLPLECGPARRLGRLKFANLTR